MWTENVIPPKLWVAPSIRHAIFIEEAWSPDGRPGGERSAGHLPTPRTIDHRRKGDGG
jgi:hypothetical protein